MPTPTNRSSKLPDGYALENRDPSNLEPAELATMLQLLDVGAAVSVPSAKQEIPHATTFLVLLHEGKIVGLGAIKQEREWYAELVQSEKKSHYPFSTKMLELGYVVVASEHGGKHLSGHIADALLANYDGDLFATTDDPRMKATLEKRGFVQKGKEWKDGRDMLSLWLRSKPQ
jgi:hypothetical protein